MNNSKESNHVGKKSKYGRSHSNEDEERIPLSSTFYTRSESQVSRESSVHEHESQGFYDRVYDTLPKKSFTATVLDVVANQLNISLLLIPFAYKQAGLTLGLLITLTIGIISDFLSQIFFECYLLSNASAFLRIIQIALGNYVYKIASVLLLIHFMFQLIACTIAIADTLVPIFYEFGAFDTFLSSRTFIQCFVTGIILLPVTILTKPSKRGATSFVMVVLIAIYTILCLSSIAMQPNLSSGFQFRLFSANFVDALFIIVSYFFVQHRLIENLMNLTVSYDRQNEPRRVIHTAHLITTVIAMAVGTSTYIIHSHAAKQNALNNFCYFDAIANIMRILIFAFVIVSYPQDMNKITEILKSLLIPFEDISSIRIEICTIGLICTILLLSFVSNCLAYVQIINSIVSIVLLMFILPLACHSRLKEYPILSLQNGLQIILFVTAMAFGTWGLVGIFAQPDTSYCNSAYCYLTRAERLHFETAPSVIHIDEDFTGGSGSGVESSGDFLS